MNYIYIFNDLLTAWACLIYISLAPYCLVYFQFHSSLNFMWRAVTEYVRSPSITFVLRCIWERKCLELFEDDFLSPQRISTQTVAKWFWPCDLVCSRVGSLVCLTNRIRICISFCLGFLEKIPKKHLVVWFSNYVSKSHGNFILSRLDLNTTVI